MTEDFEEDDMLAAEYVMGVLGKVEQDAVRMRASSDPPFALKVWEWETHLSQMADLDPIDPPVALKNTILKQLFGETEKVSLWHRLGLWRALSGGLVAALLLLTALVLQPLVKDTTGPLYTAEIASEAGDFRVIAVVDKIRNEVILTRTDGAAPSGRILQVWAHGPDKPAQSVGLWPEGATVRLSLPSEIAAVQGTLTLGVSEEPPGGSLTGLPSGRVFGTVDIPDVS